LQQIFSTLKLYGVSFPSFNLTAIEDLLQKNKKLEKKSKLEDTHMIAKNIIIDEILRSLQNNGAFTRVTVRHTV